MPGAVAALAAGAAVATRAPEARFPIRLVALDLDGTLIENDGPIRERTRRAVAAVVALGVPVVIATGRMATSVRPFVDALGLQTPIIGYQGGLVRDVAAAGRGSGACSSTGRSPPTRHGRRSSGARRTASARTSTTSSGSSSRSTTRTSRTTRSSWAPGPRSCPTWRAGSATRSPRSSRSARPGRPEALLDGARAAVRRSGRRDREPSRSSSSSSRRASRRAAPSAGSPGARASRWSRCSRSATSTTTRACWPIVGHGVAMLGAPDDVRAASRYVAPGGGRGGRGPDPRGARPGRGRRATERRAVPDRPG